MLTIPIVVDRVKHLSGMNSQDCLDLVFNKGHDVNLFIKPFIELPTVLDATPQINCCMITTNKNTYICSLIL